MSRSDLRWWAGAAALDILTILVVLPLFNHWWTFDRARTLSPLELAVAFNAPLVRNIPSTSGAEGVVKDLGDVRVRFGAFAEDDGLSANNRAQTLRSRLGIGRAENMPTLET